MFIQNRLLFLVIISYSFLSLCLHWKYIFFVSNRSVKYANFRWIWLYVVVNDRLVFTFQKLVHTRVTLCHREFTLERRMGDLLNKEDKNIKIIIFWKCLIKSHWKFKVYLILGCWIRIWWLKMMNSSGNYAILMF